MSNLDWMDLSACRDEDPDLFFPSAVGLTGQRQAHRAALICADCPVTSQCRDHKLRTGADTGVWGGNPVISRRVSASSGGPHNAGALHGTDAGYKRHYRRGETPCTACKAAHSAKGAPNGRSKTRWSA